MPKININNIDLRKLGKQLRKYESEWIAISERNKIVASGKTYEGALAAAQKKEFGEVILFKVPPLDYSLSP